MCRYRPDVFPAAFAQWKSDKKHQVRVRWWLCSSRRRKCCCLKRPKPEEAAAEATTGPQDPPALIPQHPSLPLPSPSTLCMPLCSQVQERQGLSQNGHVTAATCTHSVERGTSGMSGGQRHAHSNHFPSPRVQHPQNSKNGHNWLLPIRRCG